MESYAYNDKSVMERLVAEAPYLSRCSDDKTARCVRPVKYAVNFPYMQVNRSGMVSWLVFDLDHDKSAYNPFFWWELLYFRFYKLASANDCSGTWLAYCFSAI